MLNKDKGQPNTTPQKIIIIIIERRDYGGVLSEDCEDTEKKFRKSSKVRETVLRTRNCHTAVTIMQDSF